MMGLSDNRTNLSAPRSAAETEAEGGASCSPFGEHRRRRLSGCYADMTWSGPVARRYVQVAAFAGALAFPALLGCSVHRVAAGAATVGYDVLEEEKCAAPGEPAGVVTTLVRDETGSPIPGVHVLLAEATGPLAGGRATADTSTDAQGSATLSVPGERYYTLLVSALGFYPEARQLLLRSGCSGKLRVTLRVIQTEGLS